MVTLRTYSPIWTAERRIRKLGNLKLPFDVSFKQMGVAGVTFTMAWLGGKVITYPNPLICYLVLPLAITWFLTKATLDGKPPAAWVWTVTTWVFRRKVWSLSTWDPRKSGMGGRPLKGGRRMRLQVKVRTAGG